LLYIYVEANSYHVPEVIVPWHEEITTLQLVLAEQRHEEVLNQSGASQMEVHVNTQNDSLYALKFQWILLSILFQGKINKEITREPDVVQSH
jgi:hypothetical protein